MCFEFIELIFFPCILKTLSSRRWFGSSCKWNKKANEREWNARSCHFHYEQLPTWWFLYIDAWIETSSLSYHSNNSFSFHSLNFFSRELSVIFFIIKATVKMIVSITSKSLPGMSSVVNKGLFNDRFFLCSTRQLCRVISSIGLTCVTLDGFVVNWISRVSY